MWSTVLKLALICLCCVCSPYSWGKEAPPRMLREPLLGLQYDRMVVNFVSLPTELRARCPTLADTENMQGNWYIYGQAASSAGDSYYIAGGYFVRAHPRPPELPEFELDGGGVIFMIRDGECMVFEEAARTMFEPFLADEIPADVLLALAQDHIMRLAEAFGGRERLKAAVRSQKVAIARLPKVLRQAYQRFLFEERLPDAVR